MYLGFYGLRKEPFQITPDPEFLFLSPSHKEAFASIVYGVMNRKGFVELTGEVGTGKTTILRAYLEQIDKREIHAIYIFNPDLSFEELLQALLREMGIEVENRSAAAMLGILYVALIEEYKHNRNVVLIVDEAQVMPDQIMDKLRMLSNLETNKDKLLQIILVGQPELEQKLEQHGLRQLKQRIAVRAQIRPLTPAESFAYVQHRLAVAGNSHGRIFARSALKEIVRYAKGSPRSLNIACDNSLIAGYGAQKKPVPARIADEVIADLSGQKKRRYFRWMSAWATVLLFLAVMTLAPSERGIPIPGNQNTGNSDVVSAAAFAASDSPVGAPLAATIAAAIPRNALPGPANAATASATGRIPVPAPAAPKAAGGGSASGTSPDKLTPLPDPESDKQVLKDLDDHLKKIRNRNSRHIDTLRVGADTFRPGSRAGALPPNP